MISGGCDVIDIRNNVAPSGKADNTHAQLWFPSLLRYLFYFVPIVVWIYSDCKTRMNSYTGEIYLK
jgi:hypothetical protein